MSGKITATSLLDLCSKFGVASKKLSDLRNKNIWTVTGSGTTATIVDSVTPASGNIAINSTFINKYYLNPTPFQQSFTSAGSYNLSFPANRPSITVYSVSIIGAMGGGGGGGAGTWNSSQGFGAGGGGGGGSGAIYNGTAITWNDVNRINSVTIGASGTTGANGATARGASGSSGNTGGSTEIFYNGTSLYRVLGGSGGSGGTGGAGGGGGAGGVGTTGQTNGFNGSNGSGPSGTSGGNGGLGGGKTTGNNASRGGNGGFGISFGGGNGTFGAGANGNTGDDGSATIILYYV
jgi:hypothetical protein